MSVLATVQTVLCERLALNPDDVEPESRLFDDLGADSLDLLDLLFTLEKRFGVKLRNSELDRLLRGELSEQEQGPLGEPDLERLYEWLPSLREAPRPLYPADLFSHITVASLARVVELKQKELQTP